MRYTLTMLITAILLVGCQSSREVIRNKQYDVDQDFSARRVTLYPVPGDAITIEDTTLIQKDFAADRRAPSLVVQDSLYRKIIFQTSQSLLQTEQLTGPTLPFNFFRTQTDTSRFFAVDLPVRISKRDSICRFYVPRKEFFPADSIDVGVIINGISIGTNQSVTSSGGHYMPGHTVTTPGGTFTTAGSWFGGGSAIESQPVARIQFIMWDYKSNQPIAHGFTQAAESKVLGGNSLTTIFRVVAQRLFEDSPFRFRKIVW